MIEVISHHFGGGIYCKLMRIKEDHEVVSHKHNYDHLSMLFSGCVIVEADGVQKTYWSPDVIEIKAGIDHSVIAVNGPAIWGCTHATDCTDVSKVDEVLIQKRPAMTKLNLRVDVSEALKQLNDKPELWNQYDMRTRLYPDSPHREVSDIWLRYRDWSEFDPEHPEEFSNEHETVDYPALRELWEIDGIIAQVILQFSAKAKLGGCLITKIPPGKQCYPHSDKGSWHADYYNKKVLVLLQSAPGQSFNFEHERYEGEAGEVFVFDNHPVHSVTNNSDIDRISLILAIRDIDDE